MMNACRKKCKFFKVFAVFMLFMFFDMARKRKNKTKAKRKDSVGKKIAVRGTYLSATSGGRCWVCPYTADAAGGIYCWLCREHWSC